MFSIAEGYPGEGDMSEYSQLIKSDIIIPDWIKRLPVQFQMKLKDQLLSWELKIRIDRNVNM